MRRGRVRKPEWGAYVKRNRQTRQLTRWKLAQQAEIDPSYVTLIENSGYVPRRDKVIGIARALRIDLDLTLLNAGYAPETIPLKDLLERLEQYKTHRMLEPNLRRAVRELHNLTPGMQKSVAHMLTAFVSTMQKGA